MRYVIGEYCFKTYLYGLGIIYMNLCLQSNQHVQSTTEQVEGRCDFIPLRVVLLGPYT